MLPACNFRCPRMSIAGVVHVTLRASRPRPPRIGGRIVVSTAIYGAYSFSWVEIRSVLPGAVNG